MTERARASTLVAILSLLCGGGLEAQDDAARRAVAWLAARPAPEIGSPRDDVTAALCAFLVASGVGGRDLPGPDDGSIERIAMADSVVRSAYANWMTGFGSLYLAEASLRDGEPHASWPSILDALGDRLNAEGGFGHGGPEALATFYPTTLVATTAWALLAHGLARMSGLESATDRVAVLEAAAMLRAVQTSNGAFPYGGRDYRKGPEAGRTAGVVAALAALARRDDAMFAPAARYVERNWNAVPHGHASPAMHVLFGAMAACALGEDAWLRFDAAVLERVRAVQRSDGSFDDVVPGSPDSLGLLGDELSERAYRTSCYAAALVLPHTRVGRALVESARTIESPAQRIAEPGAPAPLWSLDVSALDVATRGDEALLLLADGRLLRVSCADGRRRGEPVRVVSEQNAHRTELLVVGSTTFAVTVPRQQDPPTSLAEATAGRVITRIRAVSRDGEVGEPHELRGGVVAWSGLGEDLCLMLRGGRVVRVRADGDGADTLVRAKPAAVNACLVALPRGDLLCAAESELVLLEADRRERWYARTRHARGMTPPAFTAACALDDAVCVAASDGSLVALLLEDGSSAWRLERGAAIRWLVRLPRTLSVIAWSWDGRVERITKGVVDWSVDVTSGLEIGMENGLACGRTIVWAQSSGVLSALDGESGELLARLPFESGRFSVAGDDAIVVTPDSVRCVAAR